MRRCRSDSVFSRQCPELSGRRDPQVPDQPYWLHDRAALILPAIGVAAIMRSADPPSRPRPRRGNFASVFAALLLTLLGWRAAEAVEMSSAIAALYSSVSIYPPSATSMTVCYGFVCRRREILDFGAGDRSALTQIMAAGHAFGRGRARGGAKGGDLARPAHGVGDRHQQAGRESRLSLLRRQT